MLGDFDDLYIAEAIADPRGTFGSPDRVVGLDQIDLSDRIEILKSWQRQEKDMAELQKELSCECEKCLYDEVTRCLKTLQGDQGVQRGH